MTIKNSGNPLSFTEIEAEFGSGGGQRRLGKYRRDDPAFNNHGPFPEADNGQLGSRPLDDGIPTGQNSPIKFSEFYGKKLNMIIDYYSGSNQNRTGTGGGSDNNQIATWKYQNESSKVKVVGGFKTRPSGSYDSSGNTLDSSNWQGGKKVIIHVNKRIGSEQASSGGFGNPDRRRCALRTGAWPSGTDLRLDIGSSGELLGAGGDGRKGSAPSGAKPAKAGNGTSALGVQYPVHIDNNGAIRCGYGGGGGGSGGNSDPSKSSTDYGRSGGGGGGGAGFPAGDGGSAGTGAFGPPSSGNDGGAGGSGSPNAGGSPGDGGNSSGGASGGKGGRGGDQNDAAENGSRGQSPNRKGYGPNQPGGDAGTPGFGIIFRSTAVENASDGNTNTPGARGGDNVSNSIS